MPTAPAATAPSRATSLVLLLKGVWLDLYAGDDGEGSDHEGVQSRHQGPLQHRDGREVTG